VAAWLSHVNHLKFGGHNHIPGTADRLGQFLQSIVAPELFVTFKCVLHCILLCIYVLCNCKIKLYFVIVCAKLYATWK